MVKEFLKENALVVVIGTVLTFMAMNYMEGIRGDIAIGGEVFILPMLLFLKGWFRMIQDDGLLDCFLYDDDDEEDEDDDI